MSRALKIVAVFFLVSVSSHLFAQDGDENVSLGDLARSVRKSKAPPDQKVEEKKVIDNDNFAVMMDKAESARLSGKPVFSINPISKTFSMVSPDGSCSLSFDAKAGALNSAAYIASDLPQDELLKLEGPASVSDDQLEVSVHNGTSWELKEIVVGITVLQQSGVSEVRSAKLVTDDVAVTEKPADLTVLYHLKGVALPDSTTVFHGSLGGSFGLNKTDAVSKPTDWHWAIVAARGIPPASPPAGLAQQATVPGSAFGAAASVATPSDHVSPASASPQPQ